VESNATNRAFLEIGFGDLFSLEANNVPYWNQAYYVVNSGSPTEVNNFLTLASKELKSRAILIEFNSWPEWGDSLKTDIANVHASGLRTFAATKDSPITATVQNHLDLYAAGFDVAYTYNLGNAVEARVQVNTARGLTPP